jgi:hypothetical protein
LLGWSAPFDEYRFINDNLAARMAHFGGGVAAVKDRLIGKAIILER